MKILHVCPRYWPIFGGVEEHVQNICERLALQNEVEVCTTDPSGLLPREEVINQVKVNRFPAWAPSEAYFFSRQLKGYLGVHSTDFDLVHAHNYGAFPALYAALSKTQNKLVFTPHYHGTGHTLFRSLLHRPYKFWGRKIFEKADRIICVSKFEMSLITKNYRDISGKVVLIPNGIDLKEFTINRRREKQTRNILTVCRLERYKGVQYLIQVLPRISRDIVLEIIGKGPYKADLIKLAAKLDLSARVMFFEDISRRELLQKYADADVFALLSEHEAYGICVGEALLSKTPCIVANTSALTEWIDNRNCYGVDYPIDLNILRVLIERLMGYRVKSLPKVSDWNDVAEEVLKLYRQLVPP
jgi:glycosyltransferase involved in cell wall biosynthesis